MSLYDYQISRKLFNEDVPFYALLMAAMRKADDINTEKLKCAWPEIWKELNTRYHSPNGILESDRNDNKDR